LSTTASGNVGSFQFFLLSSEKAKKSQRTNRTFGSLSAFPEETLGDGIVSGWVTGRFPTLTENSGSLITKPGNSMQE
jgi:hypothetical protein